MFKVLERLYNTFTNCIITTLLTPNFKYSPICLNRSNLLGFMINNINKYIKSCEVFEEKYSYKNN